MNQNLESLLVKNFNKGENSKQNEKTNYTFNIVYVGLPKYNSTTRY